MPGPLPDAVSADSSADLVALGAKGSMLLAGTADGAFFLDEAHPTLSPLAIWGDEPDLPAETGAIRAIGRRTDNLLVAADTGLFHTSGEKLLLSPASAGLAALDIVGLEVEGAGDAEQIWIAAKDGVHQISGGALSKLAIEGEDGAPGAVLPALGRVFAAFDDRLYEVDPAAKTAELLPYHFGAIHALARGAKDSLYVGCDQGLFERDPDGSYTQYTLSDDAGAPAPVQGLLFDPKKGVFAITGAGIVVLQPGEAPAGVAGLSPGTPSSLATIDDRGLVWVGGKKSLTGLPIGGVVGFAEDVSPVLATYCNTCHATGASYAPVIDFTDYETAVARAGTMIQRIAAGQMPPQSAKAIPAEDVELLLRWNASGRTP
jgi:hypothetical protein